MSIIGQGRFACYVKPLKRVRLIKGDEGGLMSLVGPPRHRSGEAVIRAVRSFLSDLPTGRRNLLLQIGGPARGRRPDIVAFQVQFVVQFVEHMTGKHMNGWREPLLELLREIRARTRRMDLQSVLALIALELFWREWE